MHYEPLSPHFPIDALQELIVCTFQHGILISRRVRQGEITFSHEIQFPFASLLQCKECDKSRYLFINIKQSRMQIL